MDAKLHDFLTLYPRLLFNLDQVRRPLRTFQDPSRLFPDFLATSQDLSRPPRSGKVGI